MAEKEAEKAPAEVPVVAVAVGEAAAEQRDRSDDDVFTKFVVCIVDYSWLVILITVGVSFILGIWTCMILYDQGGDRTFAFGDGNSDRDDIRTLSYEAVQQAQGEHGYRMRTGSNDIGAQADPGQELCGDIRREAGEETDGDDKGRRRLQAGSGSRATLADGMVALQHQGLFGTPTPDSARREVTSKLGFLPGTRPPVGPPPPSYRAWANRLARQHSVSGDEAAVDSADSVSHRALQQTNQGVCDIFDWGSGVTLRQFESRVHEDVWGTDNNPWIPTVSHEDHNQEIRYCYRDTFAEEIDDFDPMEQFLMRWRGNITVTEEATYEFMTESDDGSYLYVDGERVVENGGFHGPTAEVGSAYLTPGEHAITITFFEAGGGAALTAGMRAPGGDWAPLSGVGFKFDAYGCGAPASMQSDNSDVDFSVCDPFAEKTEAGATEGPSGPGCNKLCNPDSPGCTGTQTRDHDFFILVFEGVSGSNPYYTSKDDTTAYTYDKYDLGAGDLFAAENLAEVKRLEASLLENEEACIAKDEDEQSKCDGKDLSGGFAESMSACIGKTVTLDVAFDLSELNDESETCRYNPGYKAFCKIEEGPDTTGRCGKIFGMLNFFFPRNKPEMGVQVAELLTILVTSPDDFSLILSSDLGCQIQWFTHSLFEGENSFGALFLLLEAVMASMAAGTLDTTSTLGSMYGVAMCEGMASSSEQICSSTPGCLWSSGTCVNDDDKTGLSERFGELMCFGDGSGDELTGSALTQRTQDLAVFFDQPHIQPYLSFYFDEGFSSANPHLKFTRGWMQFGAPIEGFEDPFELYEIQENTMVDWFQANIRPKFRENQESEEPNETTGGQVEITYLLGSLLETEIISLLIGDVLLAELSFLIVGFYMWFMTGSFWISCFGMMEISISLPLGYWVYTYIFGIEYFDPVSSDSLTHTARPRGAHAYLPICIHLCVCCPLCSALACPSDVRV